MYREQQHQYQAKPESRYYLCQHRKSSDQVVEYGVAVDDAQHSEGEAQTGGQQESRAGELQRVGEPQGDEPGDIDVLSVGDSQVAMQRIADIHTVLLQHRPIIYQMIKGVRRDIAGGYVLQDDRTAGFALGAYDRDWPLIIDPTPGRKTDTMRATAGVLGTTCSCAGWTDSRDACAVPTASAPWASGPCSSAAAVSG